MTTITINRATVEQALEALKDDQYRLVEVSPNQYEYKTGLLVEVGPNQYEYKTDLAIAALEAALAQQAEPVEPVAWVYTGIKQDGTEHGPHLVWKPEYMDAMSASKGAKATPVYTAPPQRKLVPLTDEDIERIFMTYQSPRQAARAVERAHGITDPQVADRLARHGIPMPEGDPK